MTEQQYQSQAQICKIFISQSLHELKLQLEQMSPAAPFEEDPKTLEDELAVLLFMPKRFIQYGASSNIFHYLLLIKLLSNGMVSLEFQEAIF